MASWSDADGGKGAGPPNSMSSHSALTLGVGSVAFHPALSSESAKEGEEAWSSGENAPSTWSKMKGLLLPWLVTPLSLALAIALVYITQSYLTTKPPTLELEASLQVPGTCPKCVDCSAVSLLGSLGYTSGASGPSAGAEGKGEAQGEDGGGAPGEGGKGLLLEGGRGGQAERVMLELSLIESEKEYNVNMARRKQAEFDNPGLQNPDKPAMQVVYLMPMYPCGMEGHFGYWGDGGKWMCLRTYDSKKKPFVVSVGCNGETSFEKDIFERMGGFSHTFDFSLSKEQVEEISKFDFMKLYNAGLSGKSQLPQYAAWLPMEKFITVPELLNEIGRSYADILKIDCESCEYEVVQDLTDIYTKETVPFGQILMEIHGIDNTTRCMGLFRNLEKLGYRMFHSEINGLYDLGYEVAYVHEKLVKPRGLIPT